MNDMWPSPVNAKVVQEILSEVLEERLKQMGLARSSNYVWHEQALKEIRRGFSYMPLKGASGTFTWGVNLDFLPVVLNGKIVYHKSAKKYLHHLFEWPDEYANAFVGGRVASGVTTHWGLQETRKSIGSVFEKYEKTITTWFDMATTVENLINIAEKQVSVGKYYDIHSPGPKYVLAFLLARAGRLDAATKQFESLDDHELGADQEVRDKLKALLTTLADRNE